MGSCHWLDPSDLGAPTCEQECKRARAAAQIDDRSCAQFLDDRKVGVQVVPRCLQVVINRSQPRVLEGVIDHQCSLAESLHGCPLRCGCRHRPQ
jgi:hypothetical protein